MRLTSSTGVDQENGTKKQAISLAGAKADPIEDQELCGGIIRGKPRDRKDGA
jgi:hypothetical protein